MNMSETNTLPLHLGLILDGNRRWATERGIPTLEGHRQGYDNLKVITKAAVNRGVLYISAFIFSTENWNRTRAEVKYLMGLAYKVVAKDINELNKENIRVVWLGSRDKLSEKLLNAISNAEELTKTNVKATLALCFNYGGQQEIADASNKVMESGELITPEKIRKNLYHPEVPDLDFIIRTSGEQRLSNFMLWRAAYAELYFSKKHWPAFNADDLDEALAEYANRQRRFGS